MTVRVGLFLALAAVIECLGLVGLRYPLWHAIAIVVALVLIAVSLAVAIRRWRIQARLNPAPVVRVQPVRKRHWHWW
ncbi:MAG: hypothetical protein IRZ10_02960 [Thermoflavifilum sp.]|nr:hypothetical protein [Thermoflavifilum sp.]MCL6513354.1 DUF4175 domain-containing protein [Alicyclobacillus sp.]